MHPNSEKRVQQGWGGEDGERELKSEEQASADALAEASAPAPSNDWANAPPATDDWAGSGAATTAADDWGAPPETNTAGENADTGAGGKETGEYRRRRQQEEEEEDNTLTLDQFLARRKEEESTLAVPKLEGVRKANEGSDVKLWENAIEANKAGDENYFVGKQTKNAAKVRAKKPEKAIIEIEAHFERPSRGAGRGRGGRGRGAQRGSDRQTARRGPSGDVNVTSENDFPSLS